ncbi:MAG: TlpA family protein disulfide reductase [Bacteroidota bacterium]|nr:TlpA family protein disulfide reductase [Bacteroidota bacterium]
MSMVKKYVCLMMGLCCASLLYSQPGIQQGNWIGSLYRNDGKTIRFHFSVDEEKNKKVLFINNAGEHIRIDQLRTKGDSLFFEMPVFESYFSVKMISPQHWKGQWLKRGSADPQIMPFEARVESAISKPTVGLPKFDISGRWSIVFTKPDGKTRPAIGEWKATDNRLVGTVITPTGDYRYLTGIVSADSMELSTFDGSHAFLLKAKLSGDHQLKEGFFYSGATSTEPWIAEKNPAAVLPDIAAMHVKNGDGKLNFTFRDLANQKVSIHDPKFRNKVVVLQIMGSWCPNCMDETAFLSDYYRKNRQRGIEIIGLAYEYSTDPERSRKSIQKFKDRFNVQYTLLNTGVTVSDSLRTEKTLPELTTIKSFPTTIFLNKQGRVAKIHAGFEGPGTGVHYAEWKNEFEKTIEELLREK